MAKKEKESKGILIDALLIVFWFPLKTLWKWTVTFCKWFFTLPVKNTKLFLILIAVICVVIWLISG